MFGYNDIIEFVIAIFAILLAVILHELAHGYAALWMGDETAKVRGRLTLNPASHFDPLGFLMLVFARFGYARPVPINPNNFRHRKRGLFIVSLAGIALNLVLAFFSVGLYILLATLANQATTNFAFNACYYTALFFNWFCIININLALFNVLPIYPLDGHNILESITRPTNRVVKFVRAWGPYILFALFGISMIVSVMNMPFYFDPLGTYITYARNGILDLFFKFWSLFA
ncbi:MAG: site-2 protease family protein [Clostridia bacterium]|nr:site-2 protease family protein [Clostridia bacterium]